MAMPMMQIRVMGMPMHQWCVPVPMRMRLAGRIGQGVLMLVVRIVMMPVRVLHRLVKMLVVVLLDQVEPEAEAHEASGDDQLRRQWFAQHADREDSAHKGREREIGARARRAEMAQPEHE